MRAKTRIESPATVLLKVAARKARQRAESCYSDMPGDLGLHIGQWASALEELIRARKSREHLMIGMFFAGWAVNAFICWVAP